MLQAQKKEWSQMAWYINCWFHPSLGNEWTHGEYISNNDSFLQGVSHINLCSIVLEITSPPSRLQIQKQNGMQTHSIVALPLWPD